MLAVAKVLKSNGTEGELLVSLLDIVPEDLDLQEPVFIEFDGLPVPFSIDALRPRGNSRALVRLGGVRSLRDADELVGKVLLADYLEEEDEENFEGYLVLDASGSRVGRVLGHEDIPGNPCLRVQLPSGKEILLPLHADLLIAVDEKSGTLTLSIPDGILDL